MKLHANILAQHRNICGEKKFLNFGFFVHMVKKRREHIIMGKSVYIEERFWKWKNSSTTFPGGIVPLLRWLFGRIRPPFDEFQKFVDASRV